MNNAISEHLSNEEKLLIIFARQTLFEGDIESIHDIIDNGIDWDSFIKISLKHRIAPILPYHFETLSASNKGVIIPDDIKFKVIGYNFLSKSHTKKLFDQLVYLNKLFSSNGIKFVALKGPAMSRLVYKKPDMRVYADLDLLFDSKDIAKAHNLFYEFGYRSTNKLGVCELTDENFISISQYGHHLFEYENTSDRSIKIEMHHTYKDFRLDFQKVYENSIKMEDDINIPNILDLFFHSCKHLWKHYPSYFLGLKKDTIILSQLMDVRESLINVVNNNKVDELWYRISELNNQATVYDALMLTERIYGKLDYDYKFPFNKNQYQYNWESKYFTSFFEHRLFRQKDEYLRLLNIIENTKDNPIVNHTVNCKKAPDNIKEIFRSTDIMDNASTYTVNSQSINEDTLWGNFVHYQHGSLHGKNIEFAFSTEWDEENFYFKLTIMDAARYFQGTSDEFNPEESNLILSFGKEKSDNPLLIYIQPKKNNEHKIFRTQNSYAGLEPLSNYEIFTKNYNGNFETRLLLPWKHINVDPYKGLKFLFQLTILVTDGPDRQLIVWSSGKGKDYNSCSTHDTILLI